MEYLPQESEHGNVEYKFTLEGKEGQDGRLEQLASQMRFRLFEGQGEAYYYLGVEDNGTPLGLPQSDLDESIRILEEVAERAGAKVTVLRRSEGNDGQVAELLVRAQKNPTELPADIKIASVGNVDAGKSTLIGVLLKGNLDDGRGSARSSVFRFLHELESGRTSSVSTTVIGIDENGKIINHNPVHPPTDIEVLERSIKTLSFQDLAGHEKYLKTTIYGLTGMVPDYAMLLVSANQGVLQMTKEHLGLVVALKIPFFIVMTKLDITPDPRRKTTLDELKKLLKIPGVSKIPLVVKSREDSIVASLNIHQQNVVPIFQISTVTGESIEELTQFLQLLKPTKIDEKAEKLQFRAYIDEIYHVQGVGTVVSGMIYSGRLAVNDTVHLGPFDDGSFKEVRVKSIHYKRVPTGSAVAGQAVTFALTKFKKQDVRKGMVMLKTEEKLGAIYEFEAEIYVLFHSTTIKEGYSPVIHVKSIRQSAEMINLDKDLIRTGDRAIVRFRFKYRPEHIQVGQRIVFREGRTKGIGLITSIGPYDQ
ncbi:MAG: GTP-binding protein [Candidatus Kariarchaeaceae archaeon]|jgi:GTPase